MQKCQAIEAILMSTVFEDNFWRVRVRLSEWGESFVETDPNRSRAIVKAYLKAMGEKG